MKVLISGDTRRLEGSTQVCNAMYLAFIQICEADLWSRQYWKALAAK